MPIFFILTFSGCRDRGLEKGYSCLALGDYPLAIRFFSTEVEADPDCYEARLGLGKALVQKAIAEADNSAFRYALVQMEACRSLRPSSELSALLSEAYLAHARAMLARKDTVNALEALTKAMERDGKGTQSVNLAGIIYGKLGDMDKSQALFRRALDIDSGDASANFNLGMILWQNGEFQKAHDHWFKALQAMPQDEDILYWFALAEGRLRKAP